jgi:hypothetical protein
VLNRVVGHFILSRVLDYHAPNTISVSSCLKEIDFSPTEDPNTGGPYIPVAQLNVGSNTTHARELAKATIAAFP